MKRPDRRNRQSRPLVVVLMMLWGMSAACAKPAAHPIQEFTFLTASSPAFARGLVEHYNRTVPFAHVSMGPYLSGASAVVSDLRSGAGQIGIAQQADAVYLAYRHGVEGDPVPYVNLRGVAVLWRNLLTVVVQRGGHYRSMTDLKGKRVGIFPAGTATEFLSRALLRAYGMSYADVQPVFDVSSARLIGNDRTGRRDFCRADIARTDRVRTQRGRALERAVDPPLHHQRTPEGATVSSSGANVTERLAAPVG